MQVGAIQLMTWYCFLCSESTPDCQVCKGTQSPQLISRPVNTFVDSVSREHTQLCNLCSSCFHQPLLTLVNVGDVPPVKLALFTKLKQLLYW